MDFSNLPQHIVQSRPWGEFKEKMGNFLVSAGEVQFTLHKIPLLPFFVGYAPKVNNVKNIDFEKLKEAGKKNRCVVIRFDCPNFIKGTKTADEAAGVFEKYGIKFEKNTFAKNTALLDISKSEEELLAGMHQKTRYNIKIAVKRGVFIVVGKEETDLEDFIRLQQDTAKRQGFYVHPSNYYRVLWETLAPKGLAYILLAKIKDSETNQEIPIAGWMLFSYQKVLYYPYGGSDYRYRDLMASGLLMWEAIRLGKKLGCDLFDMWGVADNPDDPKDPWYGFTRFKTGFGGEIVRFIDSYDFVINRPVYHLFTIGYKIAWFFLRLKAKFKH
ncbi:hypothetical protein COT51_00690 [candidate division WWE3 bacterium CG08_land_8_20_14_0_20_41_15]|uniref:Peptidoglycan bridge formation protein FemAB n=1 Tax=candidate division WWE3 bacterium CG08_land_8_20_14_0_20_41_15 TaxID=1975086 RepID=A0A2H0XAD0_UNCKA|nr:MAG: hypothetical protein COT51_00690 [candidate division WWE3 bacterium CG08_land_8_20_14_0_20_41_15]